MKKFIICENLEILDLNFFFTIFLHFPSLMPRDNNPKFLFRSEGLWVTASFLSYSSATYVTIYLYFIFQDDSFYPILRLLLPDLDHDRGPYGIKEFTLANSYIRILVLSKTSKDAMKLLNYR